MKRNNSYKKFLKKKIKRVEESGFSISYNQLNANMYEFQKYITATALKKGRFAIFANTGLGKTLMQLEWADKVVQETGQPVLIVAPLAVAEQTIREGKKFNIEIGYYNSDASIQVTNYEQLDNIDVSRFIGVVLDESSILKNFEGKRKQAIIDNFQNTEYKLACTATPAPNDAMELGNHAEFLNIMTRDEMLSMYFVHDGGDTGKWRLKKHGIKDFYQWVGSWAIMLSNPEDIGFDGSDFVLPALNYKTYTIKTNNDEPGKLISDKAVSATDFNQELRKTMQERLDKVAEIANADNKHYLIWIRQNKEGEILQKLIPDAVEVRGNQPTQEKAKLLADFGQGKIRVLITKQKIAGFGMNYQNIQNQIFASLDFSFEGLYQAIRRTYRFGQKKDVTIHIITTDTMKNVVESIRKKEKLFKEMQRELSKNIDVETNRSKVDFVGGKVVDKTDDYKIVRGDNVQLSKNLETDSVGLTVFSPPFAELYTYSDHVEDMGNSKDYREFLYQFSFLIQELLRVTAPGRIVAVHCMDLPIQKGKEGYMGLRSFSSMLIDEFVNQGFIQHSEIIIWKNPVVEMQRTKSLGLLHKQLAKDSTRSRVGIPDKILVFRKPGENKEPVKTNLSIDLWQKWASPIWTDINYSKTLNYRAGRDGNDEKHIAPLQLDTVERLIALYSNPGDTVFDPFLGIGTVAYQAIKMGRFGLGYELKESYINQALNNIRLAVKEKRMNSLFDF